jgi:hypothetical protein
VPSQVRGIEVLGCGAQFGRQAVGSISTDCACGASLFLRGVLPWAGAK